MNYYKENLEDDVLQEYNKALKVVKNTKGQTTSFSLNFIHNNVYYNYHCSADWINEYNIIADSLDFDDDDDDDEKEYQSTILSEDEIKRIARKVTSNEEYLNAKDADERREIVNALLKEENIEVGSCSFDEQLVNSEIRSIYDKEIKPKEEDKFRLKVLELKAKKLKKVEIASKLKVSIGTINKYYYTDN